MQVAPIRYYDQTKFPNTTYLIYMEFQKFFCNQLFRGDGTRCFYASEEFAFRQRLNLLSKNNNPSVSELQLPFMTYYKATNWDVDTKVGIQNATVAMVGTPEESLGGINVRFMQVTSTLNCVAFFNNDADAQLAYETLLWINKPSPQQGVISGLDYKGYAIDFPVYLGMKTLTYNPEYKEKQWLTSQRIIPIKFDMEIKSVMLSQQPQDNNGNTFWEDTPPVITNKVILDFLSYTYKNQNWDTTHPLLELDRIFNPDPLLNGTLTAGTLTDTSIQVNWTWNPLSTPNLQPNVSLLLNNGVQTASPLLATGTYTFNGLSAGSTYIVSIWFTGTDSTVSKYDLTVSTTSTTYVPAMKGLPSL